MKQYDGQKPTPELLTAYLDGELDANQRAAVESWLAADPEARADVEAQRRIGGLWQSCRPEEPDEAAYQVTLKTIQARLLVPAPANASRRFRLPWILGFAAAAAIAATVLIVLSNRPEAPSTTPGPAPVLRETPWPVASADDVFISSITDAEHDHIIIVGDPPVRERLALAGPGDVELERMTPEAGMNPQFKPNATPAPMIFAEPAEPAPELKKP